MAAADRDRRSSDRTADLGGAYNEFWFDRGTKVVSTRRTSIVVDPPDGRVPSLTPAAQKAAAARTTIAKRPPEGPEDLPPVVRCIVWPTSGPPMLPSAYNNYYQILQGPGYVAILVEMIHDMRIIPLDGRPPSRKYPAMDGRLAGPMGWGYTRCRYDKLH